MVTAEALTTDLLFGWGCVGGAGGAVVTFTLPWLARMLRSGKPPRFWQAVAGTGLLIFHGLLGGVAAVFVGGDATQPRHAIVFGLAWPTILKTATDAARSFKDGDGT